MRDKRTRFVGVRMSPDEYEAIKQIADEHRLCMAAYVRGAALRAAGEFLRALKLEAEAQRKHAVASR